MPIPHCDNTWPNSPARIYSTVGIHNKELTALLMARPQLKQSRCELRVENARI
jgi:hypothetical protein